MANSIQNSGYSSSQYSGYSLAPPKYRSPLDPLPQAAAPDDVNCSKSDNSIAARIARRNAFMQKYEISPQCQKLLELLCKEDFVIVSDDSGSMRSRSGLGQPSEWELLRDVVGIIVEIGAIYDEMGGADLHFLNREKAGRIHNLEELSPHFAVPPAGFTPLPSRLEQLYEKHKGKEESTVFVVPTDGHPTGVDNKEESGHDELVAFMEDREKNKDQCKKLPISFVMCTDDPRVVEYYHSFAKKYSYVTTTETYDPERIRMRKIDPKHPYTKGDWVVHLTLGALFPKEIGNKDLLKTKGCCIIV